MKVNTPVLKLIAFSIFMLLSFVSYSQPGGDPGGDPDVPITGIEILLGGGIALGIKSLVSRFKSKKE